MDWPPALVVAAGYRLWTDGMTPDERAEHDEMLLAEPLPALREVAG